MTSLVVYTMFFHVQFRSIQSSIFTHSMFTLEKRKTRDMTDVEATRKKRPTSDVIGEVIGNPAKTMKLANAAEVSETSEPCSSTHVDANNLGQGANKTYWLNKLKCPVCFELPRTGSIYGCRNGHHACQTCHPKLKKCAICRETELKSRQLMTEFVLQSVVDGVNVKCKHLHCDVSGQLEHITEHERLCLVREIHCPMYFRGECTFKGSMREFLRHLRDAKCCQMRLFPGWDRNRADEPFEEETVFESHVGDNKTGCSVLDRSGVETVWKPTVFLSKKLIHAGMACIFVSRQPDKNWRIVVQALVPKEVARQWTVSIEVSDFNMKKAPVFSYKGHPISCEDTLKGAFQAGQVMVLNDEHIRQFKKRDTNHLFDYRVKFELNPDFEGKCTNLVNGRFIDHGERNEDKDEKVDLTTTTTDNVSNTSLTSTSHPYPYQCCTLL